MAGNLRAYIAGFSGGARDVLEKFDFDVQITRLERADLLYLVVSQFAEIDLHPDTVSNIEMGYLYEELIRRFSELSNETAGEHFTPREVIRLMVNLLFAEDDELLTDARGRPDALRPRLRHRRDALRRGEPPPGPQRRARLEVFGQELNEETYAICRSDMMLKGQDASHIVCGNSFSEDGHKGETFDYLLANPPFGVEWKKVEDDDPRMRATKLGFARSVRGGAAPDQRRQLPVPPAHDLQDEAPEEGGSRLAIVFNGSPLFTGAAGSGESEIRRWIIENDWLEAVVALPGPALLQHRHLDLLLGRDQPQEHPSAGARSSWSTPGSTSRRCARASGTSARSSRRSRSTRSPGCTRDFDGRGAGQDLPQRGLRLPADHRRAAPAAPLRGYRSHSGWLLTETKAWAKLSRSQQEEVEAHLAGLQGISTVDRRAMAAELGASPTAWTRRSGGRSRSPTPRRPS